MEKQFQLPEEYLQHMKCLLGEEEYLNYIKSFDNGRYQGLRANGIKLAPEELKDLAPWTLEKIPWIPNGFYYDENVKPAKDPYYYAGLYYLQEPSAMTPASTLPVNPGDRVLDLCAAPGGKSTELGAKLKGKGILISNDISNSRAKALLKNLELAGVSNFCVTSESPERLSQCFPEFFDKILVDAPCSGEGMFRKERDMIKEWMERGPSHYAKIQKGIMEEAVKMLKPGGYLMYSTCTFSMDEDEGIVKYIMEEFPDMELLSLPKFEGASGGIGLTGCLRLFPHKLKGEGHFIALMYKHLPLPRIRLLEEYYAGKKKEEADRREQVKDGVEDPGNQLPQVEEFLSHCSLALGEKKEEEFWDSSRLTEKNGKVYYLPVDFLRNTGLRFLRTGLLVGEIKKERFEPSQAFAMTLRGGQFDNEISLSREDDRVIRYLKGETLSLTDKEGENLYPGWCLVCVDRFPLGWAKWTGTSLKNKYYPGWRWM
ncbi:MAG: SAM-dependent methyltransferase [Lachnospiraceae bacterium]|nr:SAM-dependent methyltransferase [Lachnospiraceae bacterium]